MKTNFLVGTDNKTANLLIMRATWFLQLTGLYCHYSLKEVNFTKNSSRCELILRPSLVHLLSSLSFSKLNTLLFSNFPFLSSLVVLTNVFSLFQGIRSLLLDSDNHECPSCKETGVSPDTLIPNRFLRLSVTKLKNDTLAVTHLGIEDKKVVEDKAEEKAEDKAEDKAEEKVEVKAEDAPDSPKNTADADDGKSNNSPASESAHESTPEPARESIKAEPDDDSESKPDIEPSEGAAANGNISSSDASSSANKSPSQNSHENENENIKIPATISISNGRYDGNRGRYGNSRNRGFPEQIVGGGSFNSDWSLKPNINPKLASQNMPYNIFYPNVADGGGGGGPFGHRPFSQSLNHRKCVL